MQWSDGLLFIIFGIAVAGGIVAIFGLLLSLNAKRLKRWVKELGKGVTKRR
ncbi:MULTISPECIES: hypothetical protein [unclassified Acidovorax]|jgi:hypothetical protein|uniref:hypothetical protein n=1 Tax=unclassified Acidovorax TaxID=2684926 RepID=UPI000A999921|nr:MULTISPECIES: hypothetical protein [unclassified Acidovorax]